MALWSRPSSLSRNNSAGIETGPVGRRGLFNRSNLDISILFDQKVYFIYPGASFTQEESSSLPRQTTITGHLLFSVANKPRSYKAIVLSHKIQYVVKFGGQKRKGDLRSVQHVLTSSPITFEPGDHRIPFSITEECTAPGDTFFNIPTENASFEISRCFQVDMEGDGQTKSTSKYLESWTDASMWTKIDPQAAQMPCFFLQPNPSPIGEGPPACDIHLQSFLPEVGPHSVTVSTNALTVGCLLRITFTFAEPPPGLQVLSVSADLVEDVQWSSPHENEKLVWTAATRRLRFLHLAGSHNGPLKRADTNQEITITATGRLPHDEHMSASTFDGTLSPLRLEHKLRIVSDLIFPDGSNKMIEIQQPIMIPTCDLINETLLLPGYTPEPHPSQDYQNFQPQRPRDPFSCACGFSNEQLLQRMKGAALEDDPTQYSMDGEFQRKAESNSGPVAQPT